MASPPQPSPTVQHVTKASSDQLLRKFAELDSDSPRATRKPQLLRGQIDRKNRSNKVVSALGAREIRASSIVVDAPIARRRISGSRAEWNTLLPISSRRSKSLGRKMGIGRSEPGNRDFAGIACILAALEKTWRRTIEGASKMFVEKHCSNHVRLISDAV
ncbi:uncharacterized protein LOC120276330 [Dioscorea cayenensis subsp. rotundata]|uniref:Uncharacterized protein LOC120276330 n=1 Tax=Dioscorea cayennensis subsp. rotundata TaxID=55577 RepID=A0AB40CK37_DIOCR|nr:uncharacterized protein LOC120276330 [Dioscorea cayenensis subsp. rotundata]